jgi:hypothetical protein
MLYKGFGAQRFDDQKLKKFYSWKFYIYFFDQKLQFTYSLASLKDAQATGTGEAFSILNADPHPCFLLEPTFSFPFSFW